MQFQPIPNQCPLVMIGEGSRFQVQILTKFRKDIFVQIKIPAASLATLPLLDRPQFAAQLIERYSVNRTTHIFTLAGM